MTSTISSRPHSYTSSVTSTGTAETNITQSSQDYQIQVEKFQHEPLDLRTVGPVRILELLPGRGNQPIRCRIRHSNLRNTVRPEYNALSNRWETSGQQETIYVNNKLFSIQKSVANFLRTYRDSSRVQNLWIDSICVTQHDLQEKNHQVRQMGDIIRLARKILVWLGDGNLQTEMFFWLLNSDVNNTRVDKYHQLGHSGDRQWEAARRELLSRDYWSRVWIVQEIVLAQDIMVYCGNSSVHWNSFVSVGNHPSLRNHPFVRLCNHRKGRQRGKRDDIDSLLTQYKTSQCYDPRDRIYGMLALLDEDWQGALEPDYRADSHFLFHQVLQLHSQHDPMAFARKLKEALKLKDQPLSTPSQLTQGMGCDLVSRPELSSRLQALGIDDATTVVVRQGLSVPLKAETCFFGPQQKATELQQKNGGRLTVLQNGSEDTFIALPMISLSGMQAVSVYPLVFLFAPPRRPQGGASGDLSRIPRFVSVGYCSSRSFHRTVEPKVGMEIVSKLGDVFSSEPSKGASNIPELTLDWDGTMRLELDLRSFVQMLNFVDQTESLVAGTASEHTKSLSQTTCR